MMAPVTPAQTPGQRKSAEGEAPQETTLEQRVLSANPLLESFGNARTLRNDNSSRFGKFIQIQFGRAGEIVGATISNYLLEKTRITRQDEGERNYHVFYQLLTGASPEVRSSLGLSGGVSSFRYLTSPKGQSRRDVAAFTDTCSCLSRIGVPPPMQQVVFGLVAAVLHLGNVDFDARPAPVGGVSGEEGVVVREEGGSRAALELACGLAGLDKDDVVKAMTTRRIAMGGGAGRLQAADLCSGGRQEGRPGEARLLQPLPLARPQAQRNHQR